MARDAAGNTAISGAVTMTVSNDLTPPVISGVAASTLSPFVAIVSWTTDEASDSQVEYGPTTAYGSLAPLTPALGTAHAQTVTGLAAGMLYHYRVRSRDAAGNLAVSGDFTGTMPAAPPADLVVYRPATPITVDGARTEWSGATAVPFSGLSNGAIASIAWDATNLYVAFQVTDTKLSATRTVRDGGTLYLDDGVEVYIDTLGDRASAMQPDDYQFMVNLNNIQGDWRGTGGGGKDSTWNATWTSAVTRQGTLNSHGDTDSGYTVELAIPWAQLGVTPTAGMYLGMDLAVNDRDPASSVAFNYFDWAGIAPASYAQPRLWKWIRLVGTRLHPRTQPRATGPDRPGLGGHRLRTAHDRRHGRRQRGTRPGGGPRGWRRAAAGHRHDHLEPGPEHPQLGQRAAHARGPGRGRGRQHQHHLRGSDGVQRYDAAGDRHRLAAERRDPVGYDHGRG